ncbi:MAG: 4-(cytidine 5'-diphospho)-2-C-methyl-D-erythritol kinase [Planctomicrobium sp.]|jgi:4-diphosphocytidyl-2-C-methyl-D-erythritol kinase|nr:4-(cytidine 5'-diphospho)-2-C-methyl-D-erythritol kinase [Planctomicrobium sp.]
MRISWRGENLLAQTPAKVNLSLEVLGKRENGFHDLETLMVSIRLFDSLQFSPCDTGELNLTTEVLNSPNHNIPTDENNIVIKAARLLKEVSGCQLGVKIHLIKRIPSEAGLGGGSSDAAATLVCLNKFWDLKLPNAQLHELAAQLGSDLNFFIDSNIAAICTGRGEKISPVTMNSSLYMVIVKPKSGLSTASVFQQFRSDEIADRGISARLSDALGSGNSQSISQGVMNSLEKPAIELNPEVGSTLNLIKKQSVLAAGMSGSGTSCFGICRSWRHAQRVAASIRAQSHLQTWAIRAGV